MKIRYKILLFGALGLASCGKNDSVTPVKKTSSVTINGMVYPTITIGSQEWTTQNYSGPGGGEIATSSADALVNGNYYTDVNINLPAGWRVPSRADYNMLLANYSAVVNPSGDVQCDLKTTESLLSASGWENIAGTNSTGFNAYSAGYETGLARLGPVPVLQKTDEAFYLTSTAVPINDPFNILAPPTYYVLELGNSPVSFNNNSYYSFMTYQAAGLIGGNYYSLRFVKDK